MALNFWIKCAKRVFNVTYSKLSNWNVGFWANFITSSLSFSNSWKWASSRMHVIRPSTRGANLIDSLSYSSICFLYSSLCRMRRRSCLDNTRCLKDKTRVTINAALWKFNFGNDGVEGELSWFRLSWLITSGFVLNICKSLFTMKRGTMLDLKRWRRFVDFNLFMVRKWFSTKLYNTGMSSESIF